MKKLTLLFALLSSIAFSSENYTLTQSAGHKIISGKKIANYDINIKNNNGTPICTFSLDNDLDESTFLNPGRPTSGPWPIENTLIKGNAPLNWIFEAPRLEESNLYGIRWYVDMDKDSRDCIQPGQQATFSFTAPQAKPYFSRGYAWVNGNKVAVNVVDKTPPSLHIYLSDNDPQLGWRDRATLRVRVEVKDNLDSNPQVQLERITMTRRVLPGQVVQASPTPVRDGDVITLQRTPLAEYELTFSAMDASNNRASFVRKVQIKLLGQGVLIM
jgi:hypothetical protein